MPSQFVDALQVLQDSVPAQPAEYVRTLVEQVQHPSTPHLTSSSYPLLLPHLLTSISPRRAGAGRAHRLALLLL